MCVAYACFCMCAHLHVHLWKPEADFSIFLSPSSPSPSLRPGDLSARLADQQAPKDPTVSPLSLSALDDRSMLPYPGSCGDTGDLVFYFAAGTVLAELSSYLCGSVLLVLCRELGQEFQDPIGAFL